MEVLVQEKQRVCERKMKFFVLEKEEKEEWRDSENLEGICVFLF